MFHRLQSLSPSTKHYLLVTGNYWAFTLTDGALRMLVVLHFYKLGFGPLKIALLFLFYEFFGIVTSLIGGWLGARIGLNKTMNIGLALQVVALVMLLVPSQQLTVSWVMLAQALAGIAKDLNKMSAKSSIKVIVTGEETDRQLYRWIAFLTGSKNALKGVGFFLGGLLLSLFGFAGAIAFLATALALVWLASMLMLKRDLGKAKVKPKFSQIFSKSRAINYLSAARLFLFGARDVWFVVALPVYLASVFGWDHWQVGGFLAAWIIGYGMVQAITPTLHDKTPDGSTACRWAVVLAIVPALIALALTADSWVAPSLILGLLIFGVLFAVNSSLHSYLIVSYADLDKVSLDVGFYYMANAAGRLLGTLLSGWIYQAYGFAACLWLSSGFIALAAWISMALPKQTATHHE